MHFCSHALCWRADAYFLRMLCLAVAIRSERVELWSILIWNFNILKWHRINLDFLCIIEILYKLRTWCVNAIVYHVILSMPEEKLPAIELEFSDIKAFVFHLKLTWARDMQRSISSRFICSKENLNHLQLVFGGIFECFAISLAYFSVVHIWRLCIWAIP